MNTYSGDVRHKTNFRFLVNGGRSLIIAGEQRHYWRTRKQIFVFFVFFETGEQANKGTGTPPQECVALYLGSQVDTPAPYDLSFWWDVKHKLNQSIKPGIFFFSDYTEQFILAQTTCPLCKQSAEHAL